MADIKAVELRAELRQIKTMADFTGNITLNVPEDCREQLKKLMDWLGDEVTVVIVQGDERSKTEIKGDDRQRARRKMDQG